MFITLLALAALICAILAFFGVRYTLNLAVLFLAILAAFGSRLGGLLG